MSTYDQIQKACENAGITIAELCRRAKVDRSTVERWKEREPKTLQILKSINEAISEANAGTTPEPAPETPPTRKRGRPRKNVEQVREIEAVFGLKPEAEPEEGQAEAEEEKWL